MSILVRSRLQGIQVEGRVQATVGKKGASREGHEQGFEWRRVLSRMEAFLVDGANVVSVWSRPGPSALSGEGHLGLVE